MVENLKKAIEDFNKSLYNKTKLIEYFGEENLKNYPFRSITFNKYSDKFFMTVNYYELDLNSFRLFCKKDSRPKNEVEVTDDL